VLFRSLLSLACSALPSSKQLPLQEVDWNKLIDEAKNDGSVTITLSKFQSSGPVDWKKLVKEAEREDKPVNILLSKDKSPVDWDNADNAEREVEPVEIQSESKRLKTNKVVAKFADIGKSFRTLRSVRGNFEGGLWDDQVDSYQGAKHQLMMQLDKVFLNIKGLEMKTVHEVMGLPDTMQHFMDISGEQGPADIGVSCLSEEMVKAGKRGKKSAYRASGIEFGTIHTVGDSKMVQDPIMSISCGNSYFAIYFWRGWHDYLWVYTEAGRIVKHQFYHTLE